MHYTIYAKTWAACLTEYSYSSAIRTQDSVLGTTLFVLYISDLTAACPNIEMKLFADDAKAYKEIFHLQDRVIMQKSLYNLCEWADRWEMALALDKCIYLQIGYCDESFTYVLGEHILKPCKSARDLSICVQSNKRPGLQCTDLALKANARFKLILKSHDSSNLARAFTTYVRPMLEYCTPAWSPYFKTDINTIENVQRAFTRKLFHICHLEPTNYDTRLATLGLQRLELRRIHFNLLFMYKLTHGIVKSDTLMH